MNSHTQHSKLKNISMVVLVAAILLTAGAVSTALAQQTAKRTSLPALDTSLYEVDPQPLQVSQCGQCHPSHFGNLKEAGGMHRFDCRECHEVFHAYNPLKNNYADIMPKCTTCHEYIHGNKHVECLNCHQNPHTPRQVPMNRVLASICADCHSDQSAQLQAQPSKHTQQECSSCHHNRHGYIPSCAECHEPHFAAQTMTTCTQCHEVHQPLNIGLSATVDVKTCDACHSDIYTKWSGTSSKHGGVSCALCHTRHGLIPQCTDCHTPPESHAAKLLEMFPRCLTCHLDVHDLPVKKGTK